MNLIEDRWLPVRRRSGKVERIAPWQLTDGFTDDPFIRLASPRPDFDGALIQFLIGLLQTCFAPEDTRQWRQRLHRPPSPEEFKKAFAPVESAFNLDGDGPRFMQDLTLEEEIAKLPVAKQEKRTCGIGDLLIESPGEQTIERNTDHFIKRGRVETLCPACAAAALFTLQTNAPKGGQGNRTGIRGGGPLTTLVLAETLWKTCWLNVIERDAFLTSTGNASKDRLSDIFPWLAQTRTSEGGKSTTPEDVHPAQAYWAMPRRIRLFFSKNEAQCDLCSEKAQSIRQYLAKNLGINFKGPWKHPLSPYFVAQDGTPSPIHPQPGGIGYRHWLGLVQSGGDGKAKREPALIIERYLRAGDQDLRLWAFGYNMVNMKARCWYDSTMPLLLYPQELRDDYSSYVAALVRSSELASWETRTQVKKALFKSGADVKGDMSFITGINGRFWQETEPAFFTTITQLRDTLQSGGDVLTTLKTWHGLLVRTAERIYEDVSQTGAFEAADPKRIALAWRDLRMGLHGRKMKQILRLPDDTPRGTRAKRGRKVNG